LHYNVDFDRTASLVVATIQGDGDHQDLIRMIRSIASEVSRNPESNVLVDLSGGDPRTVSADDVREIVEATCKLGPELGSRRYANVTDNELTHGMVRIWISTTEPYTDLEYGLFRSRGEALAWLAG
jgi:hypothetical protein